MCVDSYSFAMILANRMLMEGDGDGGERLDTATVAARHGELPVTSESM